MTIKEFTDYAGRRTFGSKMGLDGGIIVGFTSLNVDTPLLARVTSKGWKKSTTNIIFTSSEECEMYNSGRYRYLWCSPSNVIMEEPKQHDLTEILKGCNGVKLWSDICGDCTLIKIDHDDEYPLTLQTKSRNGVDEISFCKDGRYVTLFTDGKCTLWPSKTLRDWSKFERPKNPNTPKEGELVACFNTQWHTPKILRYKSSNECYLPKDFTQNSTPEVCIWDYIIPMKDYNPDLSEKELKALSIV